MPAVANGPPPMVPAISIAAPTPPRTVRTTETTPVRAHIPTTLGTPSTSSTSSAYRLLYRGALSLPDSYLLLDGLTFSARLESPMKHQLLENPLALALESMRGRQSLRFLDTVKLGDVWLDESGNVEMDIHPRALLSKIYFENMFCLSPFPPSSASSSCSDIDSPHGGRSELGVRIALGDTDGPDTTQIIVFAQTTAPSARTIRFNVARITPRPPPKPLQNRVPRPDDPIPRRPPLTFTRNDNIGIVGPNPARGLKRIASSGGETLPPGLMHTQTVLVTKKRKLANGVHSKRVQVTDDRGSANAEDQVFKIPSLPGKVKGKEREREKDKDDVFGGATAKKKAPVGDGIGREEETEVERANKNLIKRTALEYLCRTKDPTLQRTVDRSHPEFKEIWGWVYRGVGFALRAQMKTTSLDKHHVQSLISIHVDMYVGGPHGNLAKPH